VYCTLDIPFQILFCEGKNEHKNVVPLIGVVRMPIGKCNMIHMQTDTVSLLRFYKKFLLTERQLYLYIKLKCFYSFFLLFVITIFSQMHRISGLSFTVKGLDMRYELLLALTLPCGPHAKRISGLVTTGQTRLLW
jgi:hypothetical protein